MHAKCISHYEGTLASALNLDIVFCFLFFNFYVKEKMNKNNLSCISKCRSYIKEIVNFVCDLGSFVVQVT